MTAPNHLILNEGGCWIAMADGEEKPITEVRKRERVCKPQRGEIPVRESSSLTVRSRYSTPARTRCSDNGNVS